jgi:hypothetical protein
MLAEYEVEDSTGKSDGCVRLRLDQTAKDESAAYNRPEHLRAFPKTDPIFTALRNKQTA